jgi:hypothetical protein
MGDAGEPRLGLAKTTRTDWAPAAPANLRRDFVGNFPVLTAARAAKGLDTETH